MAIRKIDNPTKQKLEKLFDMAGGYVLSFSNPSFSSFVETCLGFDPYSRYSGSKAVVLRQIWIKESMADVAKLNLELLENWHINKVACNQALTPFEEAAYADLKAAFTPQADGSPETLDFLAKDFGQVDLNALPSVLTSQQIVQSRLDEIDRCLDAGSPLAVVLLVGSTLEGLLMELAKAKATDFTRSPLAPVYRGSVKPLDQWRLADLIAVSRALGILSADVAKFADHVRNFRNYIHPRQQLAEGFEPRMETAKIAQQVLHAALADLQRVSAGKP